MNAVAEQTEVREQTRASDLPATTEPLMDSPRLPCTLCSVGALEAVHEVQRRWAATSLPDRLRILHRGRQVMVRRAPEFAQAISPQLARTQADTLVTELLPLLDAIRFLERQASKILRTRKLGRAGRPFWLGGVYSEIRREPLGLVAVIGPANFPLFLPGVQTVQALAAGNAVMWKPGVGGERVAQLFATCLHEAGLPKGLLHVTGESLESARAVLTSGPNKVVFTGSSAAGRSVLTTLAETATPAVMELSGADAIIVLTSADLRRAAQAIAFGLRLNGGAVCMSPRRLFATRTTWMALRPLLTEALAAVPAVPLDPRTASLLRDLLDDATAGGATTVGAFSPEGQRPLLIEDAKANMRVAQTDIFAPVLAVIATGAELEIPELYAQCPYALTAAIFGREAEALVLANTLQAGSILVNDLIAPTADPRVPFGGRAGSGYGVTRGADGLLEMTAIKVVQYRRGRSTQHMDATTPADTDLFAGLIRLSHAGAWSERWRGLRAVVAAGRKRTGQQASKHELP